MLLQYMPYNNLFIVLLMFLRLLLQKVCGLFAALTQISKIYSWNYLGKRTKVHDYIIKVLLSQVISNER